ncbi:MAG: AmmeMemoRadiSam system radical SAM enzyme [Smithellaceae bacterium]|nr:AmmeMemoRadiSam system radical SAM enzyme [Smithellaceae bacterium]
MTHRARLWERREDGKIRCRLCGHGCLIPPAGRGICAVRENREGTLVSLVYGRAVALNIDPIEKKPLFHVKPGSFSYSIATAGCNFRCDFCQNHEISQLPATEGVICGREASPAAIVERALRSGAKSISYTYTEPTVFYEYARDTAELAHRGGLLNVFVTNGYMTAEALDDLGGLLDAANVDLKSFRDEFYRVRCGARLTPVLESLRKMKEMGVWVEVTTLLIPGENDGIEELGEMAGFIRSLGEETPWHISRFHPRYKLLDRSPTSVAAIRRAGEIGREAGLWHVYSGNLPGDPGEDTCCAHCGFLLIDRAGFTLVRINLDQGKCPSCSTPLAGIF